MEENYHHDSADRHLQEAGEGDSDLPHPDRIRLSDIVVEEYHSGHI